MVVVVVKERMKKFYGFGIFNGCCGSSEDCIGSGGASGSYSQSSHIPSTHTLQKALVFFFFFKSFILSQEIIPQGLYSDEEDHSHGNVNILLCELWTHL